jgi:hypothetical protein
MVLFQVSKAIRPLFYLSSPPRSLAHLDIYSPANWRDFIVHDEAYYERFVGFAGFVIQLRAPSCY